MVWLITDKTKKKRLILTINRKGGDNKDRPQEEKMLVFLFITKRSAKQSSLVVAMVFFKPEILRMLYSHLAR